jgi:hypothetical protein
MLNYLMCLIRGHDYERVSHESVKPREKFNFSQVYGFTFSMEAIMLGYTKTVQVCKRCGKVKITKSIGQ